MSRTYRNRRSSFIQQYNSYDPTETINYNPDKFKLLSQYYQDGRKEHICKCNRCLNLVLRRNKEGKAKKEIDNLVKDLYNNEHTYLEL